MEYNPQNSYSLTERSDKVVASLAVFGYIAMMVLLIYFVRFGAKDEYKQLEPSSGVLISFGNSSPGEGKVVTTEVTRKKNIPTPEEKIEPIAAPDDNSTEAVIEAAQTAETPKEQPVIKPDPTEVAVNRGALYKRPTGSREATTDKTQSHGATKERSGKSGSPDGETTNPGDGGTGSNFSLDGRTLMGDLVKPIYSERVDGKIVMEIQVNRKGEVTNATYIPKHSTITSSSVIAAVVKAAKQTRFNVNDEASFIQVGTITYILKIE